MKKWEYTVIELGELQSDNDDNAEMKLNALGSLGWELVSVTRHYTDAEIFSFCKAYFKREIS